VTSTSTPPTPTALPGTAPAEAAATAAAWPIGAAVMQFPGTQPDGTPTTAAPTAVWRRVLREVRAAGFDHVDLTDAWVSPGQLPAERRAELRELLAEVGLGVSAVSLTRRSVIDPDPAVADANLEHTLASVDAAADLGVGVLCVGLHRPLTPAQEAAHWFWLAEGAGDPLDDDAVRATCVERLQLVGRRAAERGVQVSLEMYEDTYLGDGPSAVALVQDVGLANVGLNPDVGNFVRLHRPVEHWRRTLELTLPHANYWHVKSYFRDEDPATGSYATAPAPMDLGVIDYRWAVQTALEVGFSGPFCVEHYGGDGLAVAARNRDYLRHLLAVKLEARA